MDQLKKQFKFKGPDLLKKSNIQNIHQLSLVARLSAQTAYKYLQAPEKVQAVDLKVLYALLVDGFGMTEKDALNLKLSDIFQVVEVDE